MSINKEIQLGLCCINTILRENKPPIYASRRMTIKSIEEKGIHLLKDKILQNLRDVLTIMDWNEQNGIKLYRMSSEMFPHKSNPQIDPYDFDFAKDLLREIGRKSKLYNQRLTFHPGQYNVIGTPNIKSFQQTILDLSYHAEVLDLMGLDQNSVIVIHGGGIYGNKEETKQRWCKQFHLLPENVKSRIVLENCEKCFSIEDCLEISDVLNIPVVFDTHHFECYKKLHPQETFEDPSYYMERILITWTKREIKPKFHISEQGNGRCGHHSDYIETIPEYLLEIPSKYGIHIDIMIEAKMKEQAILKLYNKYPFLNCKKIKSKSSCRSRSRNKQKIILVLENDDKIDN
jgi:UV DNA damage endonuclease